MADPNDGFFKQFDVNRDKSREQREQDRSDNLAEAVLKRVFSHAGISGAWGQFARNCRQETGSPTLTFDWFHANYPNFPVRLGASPVPFTYQISLRELMDGFLKLKVFTAYKQFLTATQIDDTETSVAMVFREVRRMMVLHNYPRGRDIDALKLPHNQGTRIVHQFHDVTYTLETFDSFLGDIGGSWFSESG